MLNQHDKDIDGYQYKGIRIYAAPNLHESVFQNFLQFNFRKDVSILILGSGGGAFDQRLLDNGYSNITSVDYNKDYYNVNGTNFVKYDLNNDFYHLGKFDVIIALEIIEHIYNHFHFINNISLSLNNDGIIFLSSPNIYSIFSRLWFLLGQKIPYFDKESLNQTGHINPVFIHILEYLLSTNNLFIFKTFTNRQIYDFNIKGFRPFISALILRLVSLFLPGNNNDINIFIIKRK